mmetsp:Transcript_51769/g.110745  ORF Transcript_51769/g.110745 Transcript_51769/m.110745 type:complete len:323 (-) Transcript_51769:106-1074(-)
MWLWQRVLATGCLCVFYMVVGPSLMLLNKELLGERIGFPYPLLLSSLGLLLASALAHLAAAVGLLRPAQRSRMSSEFMLKNIVPIGVCHAITLAASNAQYLHMGMANIQFLKAFTPVAVAVVGSTFMHQHERPAAWASLMGLCLATAMTAGGSTEASPYGVLLGLVSCVTEAVRLSLMQFVLKDCSFTIWESQYYLAPVGGSALLAAGLLLEGKACLQDSCHRVILGQPLLFGLAASMGLIVQIVTPAVIQACGSVMLKALTQVRNAAVVIFSILVYHEKVVAMQGVGYFFSLMFFFAYSYFKGVEPPRSKAVNVGSAQKSD